MNLPAFCIHRPAFTIVMSLVMVIFGLIGFFNLPIRWIPNINLPEVSVITIYPGANARLVEQDVTKVIEGALSGISGIETLTSKSRRNESQISITFKLGYQSDAAVADVRTAVERVRGDLPKDAESPVVAKEDPNNNPIMYVSFYDTHRNVVELSDYVAKYIIPSFEMIDGVGSIQTYGKQVPAMRIRLDPKKMAGANVTIDEIVQLLQEQHASIPSGMIRSFDRYYSVLTNVGLNTEEQFNNLILHDGEQILRLKDIGQAKIEPEDKDTMFRVNGKQAVAIGIVPQSTANPLDVEKNVQLTFAKLKKNLPKEMDARIVFNQADYIRASINHVYESFFEAVFFVWLIILAFLCDFRATLIPILTIPICIICTFAMLHFFGFSINTITLMALVLAIGLVVDDAIVMLENISRYLESGGSALQAALQGSREIIFPIIAMTLTLVAVFAPIAFTQGLLGVLFREFTFTLAGAVLISGFVALTLSPMMCAKVLTIKPKTNRYYFWLQRQMKYLQEQYRSILQVILIKRKWVLVGLILLSFLGLTVYLFLPSELAPNEDMDLIYIAMSAPRSASFKYTESYARQLEPIYKNNPEIETYFSMMNTPSHSFQVLKLVPAKDRQLSTKQLVDKLTAETNLLSGVKINVFMPPPPLADFVGDNEGDTVGMVLMTASDYNKLYVTTKELIAQIQKVPGFIHVENGLKWDNEQFQINIDREKAANLRVPIRNITSTIANFIAGRTIGKTDDMNIIVQMNEENLADPNIFEQLYMRNIDNKMLPLTSVVDVHEETSPNVFPHYERLRSDTISMMLAPHFKLAEAISALHRIAKTSLPQDIKYSFTGEAKSFIESHGKTIFTFSLAVLFIYLILVAQFESFIDPLIIILTVPFAIIGAMVTLKVFGGSLNIYSNIGLITLVGLIAKHGILITDFAKRLQASGKSLHEAIVEASLLRLRPILMTTCAMILGALPLAFAFGPGSESRQQIGLVIVGGLLLGTLFSLIVVPVAYTYLAPFRKGH